MLLSFALCAVMLSSKQLLRHFLEAVLLVVFALSFATAVLWWDLSGFLPLSIRELSPMQCY